MTGRRDAKAWPLTPPHAGSVAVCPVAPARWW